MGRRTAAAVRRMDRASPLWGWSNQGGDAVFRRLLTHPAAVARLRWMCGPGFRASYPGRVACWERGVGGQALHGDPAPVLSQPELLFSFHLARTSFLYLYTHRDTDTSAVIKISCARAPSYFHEL